MHVISITVLLAAFVAAPVQAVAPTPNCSHCAEWNAPQKPFHLAGASYFVGPAGLGSVLITSKDGHILIDGALPESADTIAASIRALGFKVEDVKLIVNSHAHFDHAGGIAQLQRLSGAVVAASPWTAAALEHGTVGLDDPQFHQLIDFAPVSKVRVVVDGETLHVGALALTAHFTPGHTPGGTSWTWRECANGRCLDMVYVDSLNAASDDQFKFSAPARYPAVLNDLAASFKTVEALPCDVLVGAHPDFSPMWDQLVAGKGAGAPGACKQFVAEAKARLDRRLADERKKP